MKWTGIWNEPWIDYAFFGITMVVIGLPHGAVDHLIHIRQKQQEDLTPATLWRFVRGYLGLVLLYGLLWYFLPTLSLLLFIGFSCYHFGQSQLYYFFSKENPFSALTYLLWGLAVLSYIICWNSQESLALIGTILPNFETWLTGSGPAAYLSLVPWVASLPPGLFLLSRLRSYPAGVVLWEAGCLLAIGLVSYYGGLLVAFSVYFGFWHSSKSLRAIVRGFKENNPGYNYVRFYKDALVFSAISIVGIAILAAATYYFVLGIHPVMLFFVVISLLTFPHMLTLETVYRRQVRLGAAIE